MKLSRYNGSLVAGFLLCLGLGALSNNAFAVTPMVEAGYAQSLVVKSDGTVGTFAATALSAYSRQAQNAIFAFVGVFNAAPSIDDITAYAPIASPYDSMANSSTFRAMSFAYSSASTNAQFATAFVNQLIGTAGTYVSLQTWNSAFASVLGQLDGGSSRGAAMQYMVDFLRATAATDANWGPAVQLLTNRVEVAAAWSLTPAGANEPSLAVKQSIIASVTPNAASVTTTTTTTPTQTWNVSTSASPAAGGIVCCEFTGSSAYINYFTVSASANPGYRFTNWTENGAVVSTSADYSFESRAARTLVANFVAESTNGQSASSDCLFNWAEVSYPNWFAPAGAATAQLPPYTYRFYSRTNAYLGTGNDRLYYLGPLSDNSLLDVGPLSPWLTTAGCSSGTLTPTPTPPPTPTPTPTPAPDPTLTAAPCTYWIRPTSQTFDASGGYGNVDVLQNEYSCLVPNPPWAVASNASWITNVYPGSLSNGQGPAYYYVQPNSSSSSRTGTITVAGNTHTVTQSGANANPFQGQFPGNWSGTCPTLYIGGTPVGGSFTMNIAADGTVSGSYSGSGESGQISGTVSTSGSLSAQGTGSGGISWGGTFGTLTGAGTGLRRGSGSWTLGNNCSGSWETELR